MTTFVSKYDLDERVWIVSVRKEEQKYEDCPYCGGTCWIEAKSSDRPPMKCPRCDGYGGRLPILDRSYVYEIDSDRVGAITCYAECGEDDGPLRVSVTYWLPNLRRTVDESGLYASEVEAAKEAGRRQVERNV